jgi:DNA polymerase
MQRYFPGEAVSRIHGQPRRKDDLIVVPMYHPAAALHQGSLRKVIEADFSRLPEFLRKTLGGEAITSAAAPVPAHMRAGSTAGSAGTAPLPQSAPAEAESQQMRLL